MTLRAPTAPSIGVRNSAAQKKPESRSSGGALIHRETIKPKKRTPDSRGFSKAP
jgi:hypothetical protein